MNNLASPLIRALSALLFVLALGTCGYVLIEGWSPLDGLFMTIITVTTIGFKEVHDLSTAGEIFTIFIIVIGMGIVAYTVLNTTRLVVEGEITKILTRRRFMKAVEKMRNHFIICGYGRMGSFVCEQLNEKAISFLVVEKRQEIQDLVTHAGHVLVPGDATKEEILVSAGIAKAKGLVSLLDSDADNVYAVLSARRLNAQLDIVARALEESAEEKLLWAGANRVISPYRTGGMRLVMGILKPKVMSFLEVAMGQEKMDIEIEEVDVSGDSRYANQRLSDTDIRRELNLIIIGVIKEDGEMVYNPGPDTLIEGGDTLIVMGGGPNLQELRSKAKTK